MSKKPKNLKTITFYPQKHSEKSHNKKNNYFQWIFNSWMHPSYDYPNKSWYGIVTILCELLVLISSLYIYIHQFLVNSMLNITNIFYILNGSHSNISEFLVYLRLYMCSLISIIIILGGTYLITRYLVNDRNNIWFYINQVTQYSGLNFIITIIILLLSIFNVGGRIIFILLFFEVIIFSVAILTAVTDNISKDSLDKIYAGILSILVVILGLFIFYLLFYSVLIKIFSIGVSFFMQTMLG